MKKHWILIILTGIINPLMADWTPVVRNYNTKDYQAGAQNWGIAEQKNGWIYFANNYGLLEYDGCQWTLYGLSNSTAVRSVAIGDDGKVYAGGRNQYGYFTPNQYGEMVYTSLSDSLPAINQDFGEVWRIIVYHRDLFVQTRQLLICYTENKVQIIDPGSVIEATAIVNGSLYVATQRDIFILVGNRLHALHGSEILRNSMVSQMIEMNGNLLIATDCNGLFIYDGKTIQPFRTDADALIKKYQIYALTIYQQNLIIGTVQRGIVTTSIEGKGIKQFTRENGLQNNTVLSLYIDQHQHLWIALDRGISRVSVSQDVMFFQDKTKDYGSGYAYCVWQGKTYLGTNQGLYCQSPNQSELNFINGSQGQVWALDTLCGTLFCSHNKGLFIVQQLQLKQVLGEGCWHVKPISHNEALAGTYTGFFYLRQEQNQWIAERLHGFTETAFHFSLYGQTILVQSQQHTYALDLDIPNHRLTPHSINSEDYQVDEIGNIVPATQPITHSHPWKYLQEQHLLIDGFYNCFTTSDSFQVAGGTDGFYRFRKRPSTAYPQQLYIRQIATTNPNHQVIYGEGYQTQNNVLVLAPGIYSLSVQLSGNNTSDVEPKFATRLRPIEKEFGEFQSIASRTFTGLQPGHYHIDIMMQDGLTEQVTQRSMDILIQLPFYKRWWALAVYVLLFGLVVGYITHRVRAYIKDRAQRFELEKDHELQQQQMQILQLEKNQTQNKLKNKSQELSHMLLSEVNRKEWAQSVLIDLRRIVDLMQADNYDEVKTRIQALQTKLTRNTQSGLDWKRFETNFDLVHEQFIAHLKDKYPWMSKQEQQLCIYIKIGLLTKEIAPLMNISTRGVEMLRYRMRQKMGLPESANIKKALEQL